MSGHLFVAYGDLLSVAPEWWDERSALWRCPACGTHRGDVVV
jgi:hypothetical protein